MGAGWRPLLVWVWLLGLLVPRSGARGPSEITRPVPIDIVLIPGFASTQLVAWKAGEAACGGTLGIKPGSRVWVNVAQMVAAPQCWIDCMKLHLNQSDSSHHCKSRPDEGLRAITVLDPGIITGPLSAVWSDFFSFLTKNWDYDPQTLSTLTYDWRLAPSLLDSRDDYWRRLKHHIEDHQRPVAVLAHSLGNNIFRYFLAWLQRDFNDDREALQRWLDRHIPVYFALGAPLVGAVQPFLSVLEGSTFGLPISASTARDLMSSFSVGPWMLPFSLPESHSPDAVPWPFEFLLSLDGIPRDAGRHEFDFEHIETLSSLKEVVEFPITNIFELMELLARHDRVAGHRFAHFYRTFYANDSLAQLATPWTRPPIRHVFVVYGKNLPTDLHYHFRKPPEILLEPYPETSWSRLATTIEDHDRIIRRNEETGLEVLLSSRPQRSSGDGVVPYASLAWAHTWLFRAAPIATSVIPQDYFDGRASHHQNSRSHGQIHKTVSFFESQDPASGQTTSIWEIDGGVHRGIISDRTFLREFSHFLAELDLENFRFISKESRRPASDMDCFWDYPAVQCGLPQFCEYRYQFGDLTLDMSCRLRASLIEVLEKEVSEELVV
jgi:phospholipid:diacylglycerol acyltransferase